MLLLNTAHLTYFLFIGIRPRFNESIYVICQYILYCLKISQKLSEIILYYYTVNVMILIILLKDFTLSIFKGFCIDNFFKKN